jgi:hypothetical protein
MMDYIDRFMSYMHEYQKDNNITNKCVTNVQYLYENMKINYPSLSIKALPVICMVNDNEEKKTTIIAHVVLVINDIIYDPSYQTYSQKEKCYLSDIKTLRTKIHISDSNFIKQLIKDMINISTCADRINQNIFDVDNDYYNKQADYMELKYKKL